MKILENKGIETTGLSASAINKLITAGKSGIVGRYLNECALSTTGNTVIISTGKIIIGGVQLEIDTPVSLNLSSVPSEDVRYQVVVELRKGEDDQWADDIFVRLPATLIQESFTQGGYTYQLELGRVTHTSTGQITNATRTAEILYGGGGNGAEIEVGEVTTAMIDTNLPAEVNINKVVDDGKTKLNFGFLLPKPYEDSVTGLVYSSQTLGESVSISNTNDGYVDEIELLGNTIGGGGAPTEPIAMNSVASPIEINSTGKNLFDISKIDYTRSNLEYYENGFILKHLGGQSRYTNNVDLNKAVGALTLSFDVISFNDYPDTFNIYFMFRLTDGTIRYGSVSKALGHRVYKENFLIPINSISFYLPSTNQNFPVDGSITISNIQLEKGSTATEYEPYKSQIQSIPIKDVDNNPIELNRLSESVYDRIFKNKATGEWWVEKRTEKGTLDGSEEWSGGGTNWRLWTSVSNAKPNGIIKCDGLVGITWDRLWNRTAQGIALHRIAPQINIANDAFSGMTATEFRTWLSLKPLNVIYELDKAEYIQLSKETGDYLDSIKTFSTETNISTTNTPAPILDVTELQMGGEKRYVALKDQSGVTVIPVAEADNTLMPDGTTAEQAIRALRDDIEANATNTSENFSIVFTMIDNLTSRVANLETTPLYSVTVIKDINIETVSGGQLNKPAGTTITLTATPKEKTIHTYLFDKWEKNGVQVSTQNPYTFTLSESTAGTYTAVGRRVRDDGGAQ